MIMGGKVEKMSFSHEVKTELSKHISSARHCQLAELAAIMSFAGQYGKVGEGQYMVGFQTENEDVVRKGFTLLKKTYNIEEDAAVSEQQMQDLYCKFGDLEGITDSVLIKNTCCQRAFLRGAFLWVGSMSAPEKGYHLEFVCSTQNKAKQLQDVIHGFGIEAKSILRKKYYVVYIKESESIVDLLNVMEAHVALMNLENLRILKGMRNSINRRVNCEAANITKTVNAASRQIEDILFLKDHYGFEKLPDNLRQMAEVRLEYPEATLKELGAYLDPPVGKSGVNHRLRSLSEIAEKNR